MEKTHCLEDNMRDKEVEIVNLLQKINEGSLKLEDPKILESRTLEELELVLRKLRDGKLDECPEWLKSNISGF